MQYQIASCFEFAFSQKTATKVSFPSLLPFYVAIRSLQWTLTAAVLVITRNAFAEIQKILRKKHIGQSRRKGLQTTFFDVVPPPVYITNTDP